MKKILPLLLLLIAAHVPARNNFTEPGSLAELVLRAYSHCYPEKTGAVIFQDGDWTIEAGNETYYWAGGRLLPAALKDKPNLFSPLTFELYPGTIPPPEIYSARYIETLRAYGEKESSRSADDQHHGFQGVIFGSLDRGEIESHLQQIDFLGKTISVHGEIAAALKRIDTVVEAAAAEDSAGGREIAGFISSIGQIGAYNWREIRGSNRMSYHSWGLAVDIQPQRLGSKAIYWLWERARNDDWMLVSPNARWMPPDRVIEAFEREGFVWGGKWALYDNMHFEYRPELHELKRLLAAEEESPSPRGIFSGAGSQDLHHLYPDELTRRNNSR